MELGLPWMEALKAGRSDAGLKKPRRLASLLGNSDSSGIEPNVSWIRIGDSPFSQAIARELGLIPAEALLKYLRVVCAGLSDQEQVIVNHTLALGLDEHYADHVSERRDAARGRLGINYSDSHYRRLYEKPTLAKFAERLDSPVEANIKDLGLDPAKFGTYFSPGEEKRRAKVNIPRERRVFATWGRHSDAGSQLTAFLQALGLDVLTWEEAEELTGAGTASFEDVFEVGMTSCQCVMVLATGDEIAHPTSDKSVAHAQPSPAAVFALGWALAQPERDRTILVFLGLDGKEFLALLPDAGGFDYVQMKDDKKVRTELVTKLQSAGCDLSKRIGPLDEAAAGRFDLILPPEIDCGGRGLDPDDRVGHYTDFIVDAYLAQALCQSDLIQDIKDQIREHHRQPFAVPLKYHYVGPWMSEYWCRVCDDNAYGHADLRDMLAANSGNMLRAAGLVAEGSDRRKLSIVSLGAGDGLCDVHLLHSLRQLVDLDFYYMVDISLELLQLAVRAVIDYQKEAKEEADFGIKAVYADFEANLRELEDFLPPVHPILYTLTGFTLGNTKAHQLLTDLHWLMNDDDLLLVDARTHPGGPNPTLDGTMASTLKGPYQSFVVNRFAFGPVEIASKFKCDPQTVDFDREFTIGGLVSSAVNVFITCKGLDKNKAFKDEFLHDLTPRALAEWAATPLKLATVTYYDFEQLGEWFQTLGFAVPWSLEADGKGIYLLQRKGSRQKS